MSKNMIIGLGNTGHNIVKVIKRRNTLDDVVLYAIDSIVNSDITIDNVGDIEYIPIVSDDKNGSGRDRTRGCAMYEYHESNGAFDKMYEIATESKAPVIVVSSAAGGTGSGSIVPCCKSLINKGVQVIPVIVCPNKCDPDAYHLNTNDLMIELSEAGIETYNIFRNSRGDADYTPINEEIVDMIEIIFGKRYPNTTLDSIDDSDLDVILNTPGRFMAVTAKAGDIQSLKKEITRRVFSGFQPVWSNEDSESSTFMTAYSLTSMFARQDFKTVFEEINSRIKHVYDEYRNICDSDNNGVCEATIIVAGLPRADIKIIDGEYNMATNIAAGMNRSKRPSFTNRKKASVVDTKSSDGNVIKKFNWK